MTFNGGGFSLVHAAQDVKLISVLSQVKYVQNRFILVVFFRKVPVPTFVIIGQSIQEARRLRAYPHGFFGRMSRSGEFGGGFQLTRSDSGSPPLDNDARGVQWSRVHWKIVTECIARKELDIDEGACGDRLEEGKLPI